GLSAGGSRAVAGEMVERADRVAGRRSAHPVARIADPVVVDVLLVRIGNIRAVVACVADAVAIRVFLARIGNVRAVVVQPLETGNRVDADVLEAAVVVEITKERPLGARRDEGESAIDELDGWRTGRGQGDAEVRRPLREAVEHVQDLPPTWRWERARRLT